MPHTPVYEEILALNAERSDEFCTQTAHDERTLYTSRYPSRVLVFKCMDGRINLPLITGVPIGKLHPFRNIGGKFTLGDPYLSTLVYAAKEKAVRAGRPTLALCTFHYAKEDAHRGCAGYHYDTEAARRGAHALKREFDEVFGSANQTIAAVVLGIETDEDALVFCNGTTELSMAERTDASDTDLEHELRALYPDLPRQILHDLLPLAFGNRDHVAAIKKQGRPMVELVHNENIIAVGRGFDWLHLPNRALIIGPYGHLEGTWREAIAVAGTIVLANFKGSEELRAGGSLLLVSALYTDVPERGIAALRARHLAKIAQKVLEPMATELNFETLAGVTDINTMRFHPVPLT